MLEVREHIIHAVLNLAKISSLEEIFEICDCAGIEHIGLNFNVSTEDERRKAGEDQYAELTLVKEAPENETSANQCFLELARVVPLRLEYDERRILRLLESMVESSEYTDRVDAGAPPMTPHQLHRHTAVILKNICSVLAGLVIANDADEDTIESILVSREFRRHAEFFHRVFEVARRYKILNPERMRDSYVKLMYLLQDMSRPDVAELLEFNPHVDVKTVDWLLSNKNGLSLLSDPWIEIATNEIISRGKSKFKIQDEIKEKEYAIKRLAGKYAVAQLSRSGRTISSRFNFFSRSDEDEDENQGPSSSLSRDEVERCLYSLCDWNTFLRFNQAPCERMIELLKQYFGSTSEGGSDSLAIVEGTDGARLSHSHNRQYKFVLQSLTLWAEVMKDMLRLWHGAEADLLDPGNPYVRTETGQGFQRVQKAPRVLNLMTEILKKVQRRLGGWIGSSTIHLGDENVPNALMFIDKYLQVPRILGPVVLCIDKISDQSISHPGLSELVDRMGGSETVQRCILRDFFKHGFDGGGASDFFSSGSCIDGRLTSAWNWCSKIETKEYYPVFQLTGFTGFDSAGK